MFLQKHPNGTYYFRWVYPPALRKVLGKRELLKSLRTSSKIEAVTRASAYYMQVKKHQEQIASLKKIVEPYSSMKLDAVRFIECQEGFLAGTIPVKEFNSVAYETLMPWFYEHMVEAIEAYIPTDFSEMKQLREFFTPFLKDFQEASLNQAVEIGDGISMISVLLEVMELLDEESEGGQGPYSFIPSFLRGLKLSGDAELIARLSKDLFSVFHEFTVIINDKLDSRNAKPSLPSFVKSKMDAAPSVSTVSISEQKSILFSDLFAQFLDYKQKEERLTDRISNEYRGYFPIIIQFIGDAPIAEINAKTIKNCLHRYAKLPVRNKVPYKGMSVQAIEAMNIPDADLVASKTVTNVRKMLQSIFNYAVQNELIDKSPMVGLKLNLRVDEGRGRFNNEQVRLILSEVCNQQDDWKKWLVRLASYTGARLGELVQLRKEDVKFDSDSQIHYLLITPDAGNLKTENAFRWVPIHTQLIVMGFLDFSEGGVGRLFHDGLTSHKATKWFTPFRKSIGIPDTNEFNEKLSFHSLRHSFVTEARAAGIQDAALQQVVGHTITSAGITDNYTGRFEIKVLKPVVEAVKY
jgi:integrase